MVSAVAHNMAANDMYAQAEKNPAKKDELMRAGDELNRKGITTLRSIEQDDPRAWASNFIIRGVIARMQNRETINLANRAPDTAAGGVMGLKQEVDAQINGTIPGSQALMVPMNLIGKGLRSGSDVPGVGWVAGAFGSDSLSMDKYAPSLAYTKSIDEKAANDMVGRIRNQALTEGVHTGADITAGGIGLLAARIGTRFFANRVPGLGGVLSFVGIGLGATTASNAAIDFAANKTFGIEQRGGMELFTRSVASFGATWGLGKAASYREATLGKSATIGFNGEKIQVPSKLTEGWLNLTPQGRQAVGDAIKVKYSAQEFAALNSNKQYSQFLTAYGDATKTTAQSLAGGSKLMARLPFSGLRTQARDMLGHIDTPWTYTRAGKLAWNAGTGAVAMGVYGLGEVNPLLRDKDTDKGYSLKDTFEHARDNMLAGGIASGVAASLLPFAINNTVKGTFDVLAKRVGSGIGWVFNAEAARVAKPLTALAPAEAKSAGQIAQTLKGLWQVSGDGAVAAARNRFLVGFGGGSGAGVLTGNPLTMNPETDQNYTWEETGRRALEWGAIAGTGVTAAPYGIAAGKLAVEKVRVPLYNSTIVPVANRALIPAYNAVEPVVSKVRIGLGTGKDAVVHNSLVTSAYERLTQNAPVRSLKAGWNEYSSTMLRPMALAEAQGVGNVYTYQAWGDLNQEADAVLKVQRARQAK